VALNTPLPPSDASNHYLYIVSDGTGETAANLIRALITQFPDVHGIYIRRYPIVKDTHAVDRILKSAKLSSGPVLVAYTLVNNELRDYMRRELEAYQLEGYDLFSSLLSRLSIFLKANPKESPGEFHGINEQYFKRMEAIEYTLSHDDGKLLKDLPEADVVLVGVSRTGKTPLSIYLSLYGLKVVNVPLAKGVKPPPLLEQIPQHKIVALTIDPMRLLDIRKRRLTGLQITRNDYNDPKAILEEVEEADALFRRNRRWPIIDVTSRSIEETATLVRDKVFGRDRLVT
jgi:regulator of PEP synthase PpsR (kinase-PPPase family)